MKELETDIEHRRHITEAGFNVALNAVMDFPGLHTTVSMEKALISRFQC